MLFSSRMVSEVVQPFWAALRRGEFITEAAESVGTYREMGGRWVAAVGGVRPRRGRDLQGRYLSFSEGEEIAVGRAAGESVRSIASSERPLRADARVVRVPDTLWRRGYRRHGRGGYQRPVSVSGFRHFRISCARDQHQRVPEPRGARPRTETLKARNRAPDVYRQPPPRIGDRV